MRVLMYSWFLPPYVGGAENIATAGIQALHARGHEITVVTGPLPPTRPGAPAPVTPVTPYPIIRVPDIHPHLDDAAHESPVRTAIDAVLSKDKYDVIYAYMLTYPWAPRRSETIISAAHARGVPVVTEELGGDPEQDAPACLRLMSSVDLVVCCSKYVRSRLRRLAEKTDPDVILPPVKVLYPKVVTRDLFHPDPIARGRMRRKLGLKPDNFVVLFPSRFFDIEGNLSIRKRPLVALSAFAKLARSVPGARFLAILPPGFLTRDEEQAARQQVASMIRSLGIENRVVIIDQAVAQPDMTRYYRTADVALVPSQEGFGLVYLEAMACGVPVVGIADGAGREVVGDRAGMFVAPANDMETGLGDALTKLYFEPELCRSMGAAGLDHYRSQWSNERWDEELEAIIAPWAR